MVAVVHAGLVAGEDEIRQAVRQHGAAETGVLPHAGHDDAVQALLDLRILPQLLVLLDPARRHSGGEPAIDEFRPFEDLADLFDLGGVEQFGDLQQHDDLPRNPDTRPGHWRRAPARMRNNGIAGAAP